MGPHKEYHFALVVVGSNFHFLPKHAVKRSSSSASDAALKLPVYLAVVLYVQQLILI